MDCLPCASCLYCNNLMNGIYDHFGYKDFIDCCKNLVIDVTVAKRAPTPPSRALKYYCV